MVAPETSAARDLAEDYDALQGEAAEVVAAWEDLPVIDREYIRLRAPKLADAIETMRDSGAHEWWLNVLATSVDAP